eukprot:g14976.t1
MSAQLPPFWSEEKDSKGRTYYSNHETKQTTWERPVVAAATVPQDDPPAYGSNAPPPPPPQPQPAQPVAFQPRPKQSGPCCTPQLTFWITVGLGWIVWAFAVVAAADDDWIEYLELAAGDEDILDNCSDSGSDFCQQYKAFTAMQFMAVLLASFAMVVFMVTLFRPARGGDCCNVKIVAMIGGGLMAGFAFCQMLAFVLVIVMEKDLDSSWSDYRLGGTFVMGVIACILGVVHAATIFVFARSSGNGPFYKCCSECMAMNNESIAAPSSGAAYQQQPGPPTASTSVPATAPVPPPEPVSTAV